MTAKDIKKNLIHIFGGTVLTSGIITRNWKFILVLVLLTFLYISNRYSASEKMARIERLERDLKDAKYESVSTSARLVGVSREIKVKELVEKNGLDIDFTKEPVYRLDN